MTKSFSPTLLNRLDRYWANFPGYSTKSYHNSKTTILSSHSFPGLFAFATSNSLVFSVKASLDQEVAEKLSVEFGCREALFVEQVICHLFLYNPKEVYGPAQVFYCSSSSFKPGEEGQSRKLTLTDRKHIENFRTRMGRLDWRLGELNCPCVFGIFCDQELVSVAAVRVWGNLIGEVFVDTLPDYRNRGYAHTLVRVATRWILEETSLIPQYDAELINPASLRIAHAVGYQYYGQLIYARF